MMSIRVLSKQARLQRLQGLLKLRYLRKQVYVKTNNPEKHDPTPFYTLIRPSSPQPTFFSKSGSTPKKEPASKKHKRKKTAFSDNFTAALKLPCSDQELEELSSRDLLKKARPLIKEHAARRPELYFYTLVAYYNTQTKPQRSRTFLQHGTGRNLRNGKNITQGCHSSFLPALKDSSHPADMPESGLLTDTHLMDNLNATMELPDYVNELDSEFENDPAGRRKSLEILDKVAQGRLDPIEGLTEFLRSMNKLFEEIEANPLRIAKFYCKYRLLFAELVKLVKEGTLNKKFSATKKELEPDYLDLLLRLTPKEKAASAADPEVRAEIQLAKMKALQTEILTTKTAFSPA